MTDERLSNLAVIHGHYDYKFNHSRMFDILQQKTLAKWSFYTLL